MRLIAAVLLVVLLTPRAHADNIRITKNTVNTTVSVIKHFSPKSAGIAAGAMIGCASVSPIMAGVLTWQTEHRELTSREVHVLLASCVGGFVGAWLMNRYFDNLGPQVIFRPGRNQSAIGSKVLGTDPDPFVRLQMRRTFKDGVL